jgi:hypothetical protein
MDTHGHIIVLYVIKAIILCTYINLEVPVFVYICSVVADPHVLLSCIRGAVFIVGCITCNLDNNLP